VVRTDKTKKVVKHSEFAWGM